MIKSDFLQKLVNRLLSPIEQWFDSSFGARLNPFYQLGGLSFFFFWITSFSGLYLYVFFETSISGAYDSIEYLTHEQWYLGGIMRSLHRYGSDAMVVTVFLHLLREFAKNRFQHARWFSWVTGVILIWLLYTTGISGYWLVWDELAQFIAVLTAKLIDWLPLFNQAMARNFLNETTLNDRFFSLLAFMHIAVPLILLLGMWVHIQRISNSRSQPPRRLAIGTLLALLVLSLLKPAMSMPAANLDRVPGNLNLDWFYLAVYPLIDHWSVSMVWLLLFVATTLLLVVPVIFCQERSPVAEVSLENCNGCERCFHDCPYEAITMQRRTDGLPFDLQAEVDSSKCVSCGLCVASCPSATPFRRVREMTAGIEVPDMPSRRLREIIIEGSELLKGQQRIIVFVCKEANSPRFQRTVADEQTLVIELSCIGSLPPSFLDFIISRQYAEGVILTGCQEGDCYHRFGIDWTQQRLQRTRDPRLRQRVPDSRIRQLWFDAHHHCVKLHKEVEIFREELAASGKLPTTAPLESTPSDNSFEEEL